jgi:hypothetical protein
MSTVSRPGELSRRELLGTVARWTVPTVVTISLGARGLAAASCPPCQKKQGGVCRACSVSAILNCQCEPCLGPPYCSAVGPVAPAQSRSGDQNALTRPFQLSPTTPTAPGSQSPSTPLLAPRTQPRDAFGRTIPLDPFGRPVTRDLLGIDRGGLAQPRDPSRQGLYQRLRPDSVPRRLP